MQPQNGGRGRVGGVSCSMGGLCRPIGSRLWSVLSLVCGAEYDRGQEEASYRQLQKRADEIASLIVTGRYEAIDIVIQIRHLEDFVKERLPGREGLFDMVYGSRFRRLWDQFRRAAGEGALPEW